jgi:hypothetical protein
MQGLATGLQTGIMGMTPSAPATQADQTNAVFGYNEAQNQAVNTTPANMNEAAMAVAMAEAAQSSPTPGVVAGFTTPGITTGVMTEGPAVSPAIGFQGVTGVMSDIGQAPTGPVGPRKAARRRPKDQGR